MPIGFGSPSRFRFPIPYSADALEANDGSGTFGVVRVPDNRRLEKPGPVPSFCSSLSGLVRSRFGGARLSAYNRRMRWLALVVLAACGDNLRAFESGSRLEAIIEAGGDDAVAIAYYRDTERGVDCTFQRDARGEWRCLPRARVEVAGYSDDACSVPIYECRDCTEPQAVMLGAGCGGAVATPVALTTSTRPLFVRVGEDLCLHAEYPPGAYYTAQSQPLDGYVGARFEDHLVTYQLGTRTLVGDDGTREMFHHAY
jgi:hypothetical protein